MNILQNPPKRIPKPQPSPTIKRINLPEHLTGNMIVQSSPMKLSKSNNNTLPNVEVDLLKGFNNPQNTNLTYNPFPPRINNFINEAKVNNSHILSTNKRQVSFSYNNKSQNVFRTTQNYSPTIHHSQRGNSMQNTRMVMHSQQNVVTSQGLTNFSNLSQVSKNKINYESTLSNNSQLVNGNLTEFKRPLKQVKIHKLGKKFKNVKFTKTDNIQQQIQASKSNQSPYFIQNDSLQVQQSKRNMSNISIQKSQYVSIEQKDKRIQLEPEQYIYSQKNITKVASIMQKPSSNHSIYLPIQEEQYSSYLNQADKNHQSSYSPQFYKKIDNKVYTTGENQMIIGQLKSIEKKSSRISQTEDFNKLSKISKISEKYHNQEDEVPEVFSVKKNFKSGNSPQKNQNIKGAFQDRPHPLQLISRVSELQVLLKQKSEQNTNLLSRLQNMRLSQQVNKQYENLEMISKLNQIEIKKLQNQLKMVHIGQKIYLNKEKQYIRKINILEDQVRLLKKSVSSKNIHLDFN